MNPFEIRDVFGPDFQEIIEVACDQVTIEDEFQFRDGFFERRETLRCRTIEHDADHHQRAPADLLRHDHRSNAADVALLEQRLGPAVTRRGTDVDPLRQFGVGEPSIALKQAQHFQVDPVELGHGRIFHILTAIRDWLSAATSCASSNTSFPMRSPPTPTRWSRSAGCSRTTRAWLPLSRRKSE